MLFVPSVEYNFIAYTDSEGLCVCWDGCDRWFNVECTTIKKKYLPDVYFCEECIYKLIVNTQMVAVALGPWASHSEDRAEP